MARDDARRLAGSGALLALRAAALGARNGRCRPAHASRLPQPAAGTRDHRRQRHSGPRAWPCGTRVRGFGARRHGAGAGDRRRLLADRALATGAGHRSLSGRALVEPVGACRHRARAPARVQARAGGPPRRCGRRAGILELARRTGCSITAMRSGRRDFRFARSGERLFKFARSGERLFKFAHSGERLFKFAHSRRATLQVRALKRARRTRSRYRTPSARTPWRRRSWPAGREGSSARKSRSRSGSRRRW